VPSELKTASSRSRSSPTSPAASPTTTPRSRTRPPDTAPLHQVRRRPAHVACLVLTSKIPSASRRAAWSAPTSACSRHSRSGENHNHISKEGDFLSAPAPRQCAHYILALRPDLLRRHGLKLAQRGGKAAKTRRHRRRQGTRRASTSTGASQAVYRPLTNAPEFAPEKLHVGKNLTGRFGRLRLTTGPSRPTMRLAPRPTDPSV
jgi:hypothetical protein